MSEPLTLTSSNPVSTNQRLTQLWQDHCDCWIQSGLSKSAYCKQAQINYHQMIYWSKKLRPASDRDAMAVKQPPKPGRFVAVAVSPPGAGLRLHLPGGIEISGVQESQLARLISLVSQ